MKNVKQIKEGEAILSVLRVSRKIRLYCDKRLE